MLGGVEVRGGCVKRGGVVEGCGGRVKLALLKGRKCSVLVLF